MLAPAAGAQEGQPAPPEPLTLPGAVDRALTANPTIGAERLGRAIRLAGVSVAGERLNPEVTIEVEKEAPKQAYAIAVPLELGGKRGKRVAVSEATLAVGDAELAAIVWQVRNDVRRSYFETLVAEARLEVLRDQRDLARRALGAAQARYEQGDAPRLDVLQVDLALNAAESEVTAAAGIVSAERARLDALLGLPLDAAPPLTTGLDPGGALVSAATLEQALTRSTELAVLDRRIEEQRARLVLARAARVPDVVPAATLTHDAQPEFTYGWRASLTMTVPLFATHAAGVTLEDATLQQLAAQRQAALARIAGEVTAATVSAESRRQAYLQYRDVILPQARQVEEMAQDAYRLGQSELAALLQTLRGTRDVRLRSLDILAQFQLGVADLEKAIGAPLP